MISFSDSERAAIQNFYAHRKLVLERITASLQREKQRKKPM